MTVLIPRHSGQSATVREGLTGKGLPTICNTHWAAKRRLRKHLSGSSTKVLSSVSPREDPNEGSYPRVRQSIEPVPSSSIDPGPASPTSMRVVVRRILRKYGYPPDMHVRATALVIEQAEQIGLDLQGI